MSDLPKGHKPVNYMILNDRKPARAYIAEALVMLKKIIAYANL